MIAYKITNLINAKGYIGATSQSLLRRWSSHVHLSKNGDSALYRAMRKYGVENFKIDHLATAYSKRELVALERGLIAAHGTYVLSGNGYNMTLGGDGIYGYQFTDADRAKMSVSQRRRPPVSEETRRLLSAQRTGRAPSQTTRNKIAAALRGVPRSAAVVEKLRVASTGLIQSQQTRDKRAASLRGRVRTAAERLAISLGKQRAKALRSV